MSVEMSAQVSQDVGIIPGILCRPGFAATDKIQVSAAVDFGRYCTAQPGMTLGYRPGCFP